MLEDSLIITDSLQHFYPFQSIFFVNLPKMAGIYRSSPLDAMET